MALSEREQQMLEEMEQALYAEDPRFATSMKGGPLGGDLRRRRIIGAVGVVAGLGLVLLGVSTSVWVGVAGFVRQFAQAGDGWLFVWFLAGGLVAAVVFAISAISVPMLVERDVTLREAIRTSVAATGTYPVEMASWAALIMVLALIGSLTLIGLVIARAVNVFT